MEKYRVRFGALAGTLVYEDEDGVIIFMFEIRPSERPEKGRWTIDLSSSPRNGEAKPFESEVSGGQERVRLAFERTKQYALSSGYQIDVAKHPGQ